MVIQLQRDDLGVWRLQSANAVASTAAPVSSLSTVSDVFSQPSSHTSSTPFVTYKERRRRNRRQGSERRFLLRRVKVFLDTRSHYERRINERRYSSASEVSRHSPRRGIDIRI